MGFGSYTASDWNKLKSSRGLGGSQSAFNGNSQILDKYNAKYVENRESFDSNDSPNSTPIIFGFDVTGSMGFLAEEIAQNSLNEIIMQILTKKPISDPHVLCAAIVAPDYPMQVTQFEADIRIIEQLLDFKLGGGNAYGYDNLIWYFAAKHTNIDCYNKRGKKGIIIGIGDEIVGADNNILKTHGIEATFRDKVDKDIGFFEAMDMASEKYELIHIVVGDDRRFNKASAAESYSGWCEAMPGRVAKLHGKNIKYLPDVVVSILQLLNGVDREKILEEIDIDRREIVKESIEDINFELKGENGI